METSVIITAIITFGVVKVVKYAFAYLTYRLSVNAEKNIIADNNLNPEENGTEC